MSNIEHKLEKYRSKVNNCTCASKKAIYTAKIEHYERKLNRQRGGVINEHVEQLKQQEAQFKDALIQTNERVDDFSTAFTQIMDDINEANNKLNEAITNMKTKKQQKMNKLEAIRDTIVKLNKWVENTKMTISKIRVDENEEELNILGLDENEFKAQKEKILAKQESNALISQLKSELLTAERTRDAANIALKDAERELAEAIADHDADPNVQATQKSFDEAEEKLNALNQQFTIAKENDKPQLEPLILAAHQELKNAEAKLVEAKQSVVVSQMQDAVDDAHMAKLEADINYASIKRKLDTLHSK